MSSEIKKLVNNLWWLLVISSVVSILFGITTLFMPGLTLMTLIALFTAYLMLHGLIELACGFSAIGKEKTWWASVLFGVVSLGMSVYLILNPGISVIMFVTMIGAILIVRGIYDIFVGIALAKNRALWIISGVLGIVAGVTIWIYPGSGSLAFAWILGLYALIDGTLTLSSALTARSAYQELASEME